MNHADSRFDRVKRGRKIYGLSVQDDLAAVASGLPDHVGAEQDTHQSGFSGAVFADQSDYFSFTKLQIDICKDLVAEEILSDIPHFEKSVAFSIHISDNLSVSSQR